MLYDKRWDKPEVKADPVSLEGFTVWLERQPAKSEYDWYDVHGCVVCQYLNSVFGDERPIMLLSEVFASTEQYHAVAGTWPWNFGAALSRARKALAER